MTKENNELRNIYFEVSPQKDSEKILKAIAEDLTKLLRWEGIEAKVKENHHMTLAYFGQTNKEELMLAIQKLHEIKKSKQGIQSLNKEIHYDQSIHQVKIRESNVTKKIHIVLTPHNPDNIFQDIIISSDTTPHISLAEVNCKIEDIEAIRKKIKTIVKEHIQETGITVDLSDIVLHF